jgi:integrase
MHAVVKRLELPNQGMSRKNRDRLRPLEDPKRVRTLIDLPHRLMDKARRGKPTRRSALVAQTAVAIEILLMAPIRLKNLLDLELERSLVAAGPILHLVFEPHEVKNGDPIDLPLPRESTDLVKVYCKHYRGLLAAASNSMLFPGENGGAKSRSAFRQQLGRAIFQNVGLRMNPHLFRHARAKLHLDRFPGEYGLVAAVLGHRSIDTTRKFYAGFENAAAMRHFDELILTLRRQPKEQL